MLNSTDTVKALTEATAAGAPDPPMLTGPARNLLMQVAESGGELYANYASAGRYEVPNGKRYTAATFKELERKGLVDNGNGFTDPTRITQAGERWVALYPTIPGTAARRTLLHDVMLDRVRTEQYHTYGPVSIWMGAENVTKKTRQLADAGLVKVPDHGEGDRVTITLAGQYAYRLWRTVR